MENLTFTKENFESLIHICKKIIAVSEENVEGSLMAVQLMALGENIEAFLENPIIKNSGLTNV
jgi:hypothetical protein